MVLNFKEGEGDDIEHKGDDISFTVLYNGNYYIVRENIPLSYISVYPVDNPSDEWFAQGDAVREVFGDNWEELGILEIIERLDYRGALPEPEKSTESEGIPKPVKIHALDKDVQDLHKLSTRYLTLKERLEERIDELIDKYGHKAWDSHSRIDYNKAYYIAEYPPDIIAIFDSDNKIIFQDSIDDLTLPEVDAVLNMVNSILGLKAEEGEGDDTEHEGDKVYNVKFMGVPYIVIKNVPLSYISIYPAETPINSWFSQGDENKDIFGENWEELDPIEYIENLFYAGVLPKPEKFIETDKEIEEREKGIEGSYILSNKYLSLKQRLEERIDKLIEQFGDKAWDTPLRFDSDRAYYIQEPSPNIIKIFDSGNNLIFIGYIDDLNLQETDAILNMVNDRLGLKPEEKHEDFKQIYNNMLKQYGITGTDIYHSWKAKYKLDDTKPYAGKNVAKLEAGNTKSFTVAHNGTYYEVIINSSHPYISVSPEESASDPWFAQGDTVAEVFGENWESLDPKQIVEFLDSAGALPKSIKQESWVNPKEVDRPGNVSGIIEPPPPGGNLPVGPPIETSQPRFPPGMGAEPKEYPPSSNLEFSEASNPEELAEELLLSGYSVNDIAEELIQNYDLTSSVARNMVNEVRSRLMSPEIRENIQNFIKKEKEVNKDYFEILKEIEDKYKLPQNLAIDEIHTVHLEEKI